MAKFPDPTRDYKAEPVASPIDLSSTAPQAEPVGRSGDPDPVPEVTTPQPEADRPLAESNIPTPDNSATRTTDASLPPDFPSAPSPEKPTPPATSAPAGLVASPFRHFIPLLVGGGLFVLLIFLAVTVLPKLFNKKVTTTTLTYWGLWEPSSVMQGVIADYEATHPGIKITYTMQSPKNYRSRLTAAISQGNGPDIARIHNTWLPVMRKSLSTAPDSIVPASILADYYPVVTKDLSYNGKIYALPLMIDGLALYYNESILAAAGATPPSDWNGLRKLAFDLTMRNKDTGVIERSGLAMGTTNNIDHWSDILGLLILQNSGTPGKPNTQAVKDAISFYTTFSTQDKIWDATQPGDIYAFATGTVAMILAPSWQAPSIAAINPDLKFKVVPAPTLPETKTAWATYWAEAVPASSKNQTEAWKFVNYLASAEVMQKLYTAEAQIRPVGEVYPRTAMGSLLSTDPIAGAFVNQGNNYTSWYLARKTYDEAINDELIKYYEDTINSIVQGNPLESTLTTLDSGVSQVLAKYPEAK